MRKVRAFILLILPCFLLSCGIQSLPSSKNDLEAALAEVTNQYKRRADLIPNLVSVVKGYAKHESETLQAVVEARAKATSVNVDPSKVDSQSLQAMQGAQNSLSSALGRLMVVVEKYPDLKANSNFRDLQAQLEGSENRITVARQRYIAAINRYNKLVSVPPSSLTNKLIYGYEKSPQWDAAPEENVQQVPQVTF